MVKGNQTEPGHYERASQITLFAIPKSGYRFTHWEENGRLFLMMHYIHLTF